MIQLSSLSANSRISLVGASSSECQTVARYSVDPEVADSSSQNTCRQHFISKNFWIATGAA